ncbi:MAG TPA: hypothetical protein DHV62_04325, partial [Elusimicrobia bacterium]|nr:hypothetical protein [Elusimicrobiota bacterium]
MRGLEEAKDCICKAKKIAICGHVNPDGDSIGSLLSLGLGIEKLGKCVYMLSQDALPQKYMFLPGASRLIKKINNPFDLAITVDCSNKEMVGKTFQILKKARNILEIDHHEFRRPFGQIRLIDHRAAAVGEMVYLFLKELKVRVTKEIAENILTSIIVETNLFRLPGVRPLTFQTCAELIKTGVNFSKLAERIYWSKTKESAILSG